MRLLAIFVAAMAGAWAADRCSPPTPEDFTLNRLFLDSSFYERSAIRERYQRLMEKHPGSLDYQYLRARSLVGSNTPEALRLYREILDKDPDYPWVHLSQIEVYRSKNVFRNREKLTQSFLTITRVCPALFDPYLDLNEIADDALAAQGAAKLRIMLRDAKRPRELRLFSQLWAVEFRTRTAAEQERERKQVAEDLQRLLPLADNSAIRAVIENGAKLIHDETLAKQMMPQPDPSRQVMQASNVWLGTPTSER